MQNIIDRYFRQRLRKYLFGNTNQGFHIKQSLASKVRTFGASLYPVQSCYFAMVVIE